MKRFLRPLLLALVLVLIGTVTALAADDAAKITSFTSSYTKVDRASLANRTARIPVEWTTENRPLTANLYFEQIMPDGSAINVELPRLIPWVSSSGKGTAAAILPSADATEIVLSVRLANLLTGQTLDQMRLTLPIAAVDGQSSSSGGRPSITRFVTPTVTVRPDALQNRSARIPVSWTAINRPTTANLVFEQIMPDGSARNVELPRDNPWVASAGDGVAAPFAPGGSTTQINLRLRLIDLITGRVFDQRTLSVQIDSSPLPTPSIRYFITGANSVDANALAQRSARIPVSWDIANRPDGTNLVFEQVLPGNASVNVELPRSNPYVSSSGNGVTAPILPQSGNSITLRLRLINLSTQATIDSRDINLPINGQIGATATPIPSATPPYVAQVVKYTVSQSAVRQGNSISVSWDVLNVHHVSLTLQASGVNLYDAHIEDLPASGTTLFTIPPVKWPVRRAVLNLNGYNTANGPISFTVPYALSLACDTHFYANAEGNNDCVTSEPISVNAAFETFERGFMVWRGDTRTVWAAYNDGGADRTVENWSGGDITWNEPTPEGRYLPQHGFGQIWTTVEPIRTKLGWALGPEQGYTGTFQQAFEADTGIGVEYFTTPDGRTYRYANFHWTLLP